MSLIFPAMMHGWTLLLGSLTPLLLAILCFTATAYLLTFSHPERTPQRRRSDNLLAVGNLIATTCWVLIYADRLSLWQHPWWDYAAPLAALTALLLLPVTIGKIAARRTQRRLQWSEKLIYAISLLFQLLSLYPGLYTLGFYLVLLSGVA